MALNEKNRKGKEEKMLSSNRDPLIHSTNHLVHQIYFRLSLLANAAAFTCGLVDLWRKLRNLVKNRVATARILSERWLFISRFRFIASYIVYVCSNRHSLRYTFKHTRFIFTHHSNISSCNKLYRGQVIFLCPSLVVYGV